jgi:hypothetical protein
LAAAKVARVPIQSPTHLETLDERISGIAAEKGSPFPFEFYERCLFVDEATLPYSKTKIWPYGEFDDRLKGMGMGIGILKACERYGRDNSCMPSYRMKLAHYEAIVSYNKGKTAHWQLLSSAMVDPFNAICDKTYKGHGKVDVYACTQSNMFLQDHAESFDRRLNFVEINGSPTVKANHRYEYLFKEEVGRLVKRKLWIDKEPAVVDAFFDKKTRDRILKEGVIWNIKDELAANIERVRTERWEADRGTDPTQTKIRQRGQ